MKIWKTEYIKYYHNNGQVFREIPRVNGQIYGIEKQYYENGQLMEEWPYVNDQLHGEVIFYEQTKEKVK